MAACLILRITDKIRPLDWDEASAARGDVGGLRTMAQRENFLAEIIRQLDEKGIVKCARMRSEVSCVRR
ncbi:MAG: hypothetical protein FWD68_12385 [Alphaproteobacteria bacterium]|nr:hypothetical protein [Alphaproteobacteria bacterium]